MTDKEYLNNLRIPTKNEPLRILFSSCLLGSLCGVDGSSSGSYPHIKAFLEYPNVQVFSFCPEDAVLGTPRETPDCEGGDGADVLNGKARVITESGKDVTAQMIKGAEKMLQVAKNGEIELAIMMDASGACGSQVIYKGHRMLPNPKYQAGMGVAAALLSRNNVKLISQRDYKSLEIILSKIDTDHQIDETALDHDQIDWYKQYFKK